MFGSFSDWMTVLVVKERQPLVHSVFKVFFSFFSWDLVSCRDVCSDIAVEGCCLFQFEHAWCIITEKNRIFYCLQFRRETTEKIGDVAKGVLTFEQTEQPWLRFIFSGALSGYKCNRCPITCLHTNEMILKKKQNKTPVAVWCCQNKGEASRVGRGGGPPAVVVRSW